MILSCALWNFLSNTEELHGPNISYIKKIGEFPVLAPASLIWPLILVKAILRFPVVESLWMVIPKGWCQEVLG